MQLRWENLSDAVFYHAKVRPDAAAVHEGERRVNYRELAGLIGKTSVFLIDLGVKRGEMVGLTLPTSLDHLVLILALLRIGAVPVDIPIRRPSQIDPFRRFGITRIMAAPGAPPAPGAMVCTIDADWRKVIERNSGDYRYSAPLDELCLFSLTSGSTGGPKGVITTQRQWNERFQSAVELFPDVLTPDRPPNLLVIGEMSFSGFFFFVANQICIGGPIVLVGVAPALHNIVEAVKAWEDSLFLVTPPLARDLLALAPADQPLFPNVRAMFVGAAPLFAEEKRAIRRRLTPNFYEAYGNAATGFISALRPAETDTLADTVGRVAPGMVVEVVDVNKRPVPAGTMGHIRCRGPALSERFVGAEPGAPGVEGFQDGWYYPGDLGILDANGYITLKGRSADLIRRRGTEIFAPEVEAVLAQHPNVAEAAVVGVAAPGQEMQVVAVMVRRGEAELEAVAQHCRAHLPPEKFPNQLFWAEKLPRTGPGKIDRPALAAGVLKQLAAASSPRPQ